MFFVWMGRLTAYLAFGYGVFRTGVGFFLAYHDAQALAGPYFAAENTGEVINKGFLYILFGIVMGILCHIAVSVDQGRRETVKPETVKPGGGRPQGISA